MYYVRSKLIVKEACDPRNDEVFAHKAFNVEVKDKGMNIECETASQLMLNIVPQFLPQFGYFSSYFDVKHTAFPKPFLLKQTSAIQLSLVTLNQPFQ